MLFNISNFGGGGKVLCYIKMQGVKFYLKNVKRGNVFILGYCKGEQLGILYGACAKFSAQSLGRGSEIQYGGV